MWPNHTGITIQAEIAGQQLLVIGNKLPQLAGAMFFIALDQELDIYRKRTIEAGCLHGSDTGQDLGFHIRGAAPIQVISFDPGGEGVRFPIPGRSGRDHVVVTVDQHGGQLRILLCATGIDHRIATAGEDFNVQQRVLLQPVGKPLGRPVDFSPLPRVRRD